MQKLCFCSLEATSLHLHLHYYEKLTNGTAEIQNKIQNCYISNQKFAQLLQFTKKQLQNGYSIKKMSYKICN